MASQGKRRANSGKGPSRTPAPGAAARDAAALQAILKDRIDAWPAEPAHGPALAPTQPARPTPGPSQPRSGRARAAGRRILKAGLALALAAVFGLVPVMRLLQPSSVEAVVNARVATMRSPIEGRVSFATGPVSALADVAAGAVVLKVENPRADRGGVDATQRELARVREEIPSVLRRIESTRAELDRMTAQVEAFRQGRIRQLEERAGEAESDIAAAAAKAEDAAATVARGQVLAQSGSFATAELDRAERARTIALEQKAAAEHRRKALLVELEAARTGLFIGDSYNDRPQSAQRRDELTLRLDDLHAQRDLLFAQRERLARELETEQRRFGALAEAEIPLPAGRLWEILTSPGEEVSRGQALVRVLDCGDMLVTASVTENVFNTLSVGAPARFRPTGSTQVLNGRVTGLSGVAGAPGNLAIEPAALAREPYRVAVTIPGLGRMTGCAVGRTGQVLFDQPG